MVKIWLFEPVKFAVNVKLDFALQEWAYVKNSKNNNNNTNTAHTSAKPNSRLYCEANAGKTYPVFRGMTQPSSSRNTVLMGVTWKVNRNPDPALTVM